MTHLPSIVRPSRWLLALLLGGAYPVVGDAERGTWPSCTIALANEPMAPRSGSPSQPEPTIPLFEIDSAATLLLGRATHDTIVAGQGLVFQRRNTFLQSDRSAVVGQVVRLERVAGAGAARIGAMLNAQGSVDAVLVPWSYDMACGPSFWRGTAQWTTPDSTAVYVAQLRPDSLWAAGRPTFDVLYAELRTYAYGPTRWFAPRRVIPTPEQVFERNARPR